MDDVKVSKSGPIITAVVAFIVLAVLFLANLFGVGDKCECSTATPSPVATVTEPGYPPPLTATPTENGYPIPTEVTSTDPPPVTETATDPGYPPPVSPTVGYP